MRSQHEKNKDFLHEKIEEYCNRPMTDSVAEHLNVYRGALEALCMKEKGWDEKPATAETRTTERPAPTPELDGDTEFERVIMTIPADAAHMVKLTHVFNKHLEDLKFANARAYNDLMDKLREVAKS